jgi:hypothetical protein
MRHCHSIAEVGKVKALGAALNTAQIPWIGALRRKGRKHGMTMAQLTRQRKLEFERRKNLYGSRIMARLLGCASELHRPGGWFVRIDAAEGAKVQRCKEASAP